MGRSGVKGISCICSSTSIRIMLRKSESLPAYPIADYPKGWPFPTKRLATSTTKGKDILYTTSLYATLQENGTKSGNHKSIPHEERKWPEMSQSKPLFFVAKKK